MYNKLKAAHYPGINLTLTQPQPQPFEIREIGLSVGTNDAYNRYFIQDEMCDLQFEGYWN